MNYILTDSLVMFMVKFKMCNSFYNVVYVSVTPVVYKPQRALNS